MGLLVWPILSLLLSARQPRAHSPGAPIEWLILDLLPFLFVYISSRQVLCF